MRARTDTLLLLLGLAAVACTDRQKLSTEGHMAEEEKIMSRQTRSLDTPEGPLELRVEQVEPTPQQVVTLTPRQERQVKASAQGLESLLSRYGGSAGSTSWDLEALDFCFRRWLEDPEPDRPGDQRVIEVLGSAFGEYLVQHLDMNWVLVTDEYGTDFAVRGSLTDTMTFPYSVVSKRVEAREHTFFVPVYRAIEDTLEQRGDQTTGVTN